MKAAVVPEFGKSVVIEDRPIPEPGPGQITVRMEASGLCHTDIHAADGDWPVKPAPPFVPGHEGVGAVHAVGAGVTGLEPGERVAVAWLGYADGVCEYCMTGREQLCPSQRNTGYSVDGSLAEYFLAEAAFAVPVPDAVESAAAAPLTCVGVAMYAAVVAGQVRPAELVLICGPSGAAHMAVQYAKIFGATVAAAGATDEQRQLAKDLGADLVIDTRTEDPATALRAHGGAHAAIWLDSGDASFAAAYAALRRGGRLVLAGRGAEGPVSVPALDAVRHGISVIGSPGGSRADLADVFALQAMGRTRVIYEVRPLDAVNAAADDLRRGRATARLVLTP
jgi:alcohol dehydrogenase, propanol-preferring